MQSQTLSPALSHTLYQIVQGQPAQIPNEDLRVIFTRFIEQQEFATYVFDILPQVDRVFDFFQAAAAECSAKPVNPGKVKPSFRLIIDWIVVLISPVCIYHSAGTEEGNDPLELIIILPPHEKRTFKSCEGLINTINAQGRIVNFTLFKMPQMNQYLQSGSLFYTKVFQPRNLVYSNGSSGITLPPSSALSGLQEKANRLLFSGLRRGQAFLEGARDYLRKSNREMAAFMLQQATELSLRAVILSLSGIDIRSHSLRTLLKYCSRFAPVVTRAFLGGIKNGDPLLAVLEAAYLKARYQEQFEVNDDDLRVMTESVASLQCEAGKTGKELIKSWVSEIHESNNKLI